MLQDHTLFYYSTPNHPCSYYHCIIRSTSIIEIEEGENCSVGVSGEKECSSVCCWEYYFTSLTHTREVMPRYSSKKRVFFFKGNLLNASLKSNDLSPVHVDSEVDPATSCLNQHSAHFQYNNNESEYIYIGLNIFIPVTIDNVSML